MGTILDAAVDGRVFGIDQQTLIQVGVQLVNLVILAFFMSKILYKPVRNYMLKRAERIRTQSETAARDMAEASELKRQYEIKLREVESEKAEIIETARRDAKDDGAKIRAEAQREASASRARAQQDVRTEWERAEQTMKQTIIEVSSVMAEKYVAQAMDDKTRERLFAEAMAEISASSLKAAD